MKLLVLGASRIASKRILPAARACGRFSHVAVASRSSPGGPIEGADARFDDYEHALAGSGADLVYVSLRNADHATWAERALERGLHVIVDKPAVMALHDALRLAKLAERRRRCLAEATVFAFHPQIARARAFLREAGAAATRVSAIFSFPPLAPGDFRHDPAQGGGALLDLGPYAVATWRLFQPGPVARLHASARTTAGSRVETSFSLLLEGQEGQALVGHFGFDTEYANRIHLLGPGASVDLEPAFTLPPGRPARLRLRRRDRESQEEASAADAFALFLQAVSEAVERDAWEPFLADLLADARLLARVRDAARES